MTDTTTAVAIASALVSAVDAERMRVVPDIAGLTPWSVLVERGVRIRTGEADGAAPVP